MKFNEYFNHTVRTLPKLDEVYHKNEAPPESVAIVGLPNHTLDLVHMSFGMTSEIDELMYAIHNKDLVNVSEELADMLWYITNDLRIRHYMGFISDSDYALFKSFDFGKGIQATDGGYNTIADGVNMQLMALVYNISKLSDPVKKYLAYGKPMDRESYTKTMVYLIAAINNIAFYLNIDLNNAMEKNIAKLKGRYPEKFDADLAQNRNLLKERSILEGKDGQQNGQPSEAVNA